MLTTREAMSEFIAVMRWSEEARLAYVKALASYQRAGCPGVPTNALNYRETFAREKRQKLRNSRPPPALGTEAR